MVLITNNNVKRLTIKLITASIRETKGVFLYKREDKMRFVIIIIIEIRLGRKIAKGGASLGSPHISWLKTGI
jgi:hypothetical protein